MNDTAKKPLPTWLPLVVGAVLVVQFMGLSIWQISRGLEKRAEQFAYQDETSFKAWQNGMEVRSFQRLKVTGTFVGERQIVLDNIIISNSRYGHYVLTPLDLGADLPLLLVNRGWIERSAGGLDIARLRLPATELTIRGRAGSLPQSGFKMGEAIEVGQEWPMHAVYPAAEDIVAALGREIQPFVLQMDHNDDFGFFRHWVPTEFGPGKHFGYALQWFAMGAVLASLLIWNYRKKRFDS